MLRVDDQHMLVYTMDEVKLTVSSKPYTVEESSR